MEFRSFVAFCLLAGLAARCVTATAQHRGGESGEVTGTLTLQMGKDTKTVPLKYVYAEADRHNGGFDLSFTDQPLPEDPVQRWRYSELMAAEGKLCELKQRAPTEGRPYRFIRIVERRNIYEENWKPGKITSSFGWRPCSSCRVNAGCHIDELAEPAKCDCAKKAPPESTNCLATKGH